MKLTDKKLYSLCKKYGSNAKFWRQKFMGLLPEVFRRKIYEQKGFGSIFEFAAKLAGVSQEQVRLVLNLERKFEDKPLLKKLLIDGTVSVNKLTRITSVASNETQEFWSEQVQILPSRALETLVRDERKLELQQEPETRTLGARGTLKNEQPQTQALFFHTEGLHVQTKTSGNYQQSELELSAEVNQKLLELQQKGIDINELILEMLSKREHEIAQEKEEISAETTKTQNGQARFTIEEKIETGRLENSKKKPSRYIPVRVRKLLQKEHGTKCSISTCEKPATTIHHTQRFALASAHDPHYLAPLCAEHHTIAHSIDLKFQKVRQRAVQTV